MCGIGGIYSRGGPLPDGSRDALAGMAKALWHRGPDDGSMQVEGPAGLVFRRLSINDLAASAEPFTSEDGSVISICNGEIFNWVELRRELEARGHRFATQVDTEVLPHLYEEHGEALFTRLNGQFSAVVYDASRDTLLMARDQLGILPLHYHVSAERVVFGSEAKTVLAHPDVPRDLDPQALDQVLTFPGLVSPRTIFRAVRSVRPGCYLRCRRGEVEERRYWDLDYPQEAELGPAPDDADLVAELAGLFTDAVQRRTRADVRVGCYLSGGLDSSLITATAAAATGDRYETMSVAFEGAELDESPFQREMVKRTNGRHHERVVTDDDIVDQLRAMVWFAETPVKESYNTCSLLLSRTVRASGHTVVLTGEGADELFGGYPGYRMDAFGATRQRVSTLAAYEEERVREILFGNASIGYERNYATWRDYKRELYAEPLRGVADELSEPVVESSLLVGRHRMHQRSYLDVKLRLADHLLGDHGDRMAMANAVEARYPFLDREVVEFASRLHPELMVGPSGEKHMVKQIARGRVPERIVQRQKYGFRAPSSPQLLRGGADWINDLLAPELIRRQGVFDPAVVASLRESALKADTNLHPHLSDDLLMVVVTLGLLIEQFDVPDLNHA